MRFCSRTIKSRLGTSKILFLPKQREQAAPTSRETGARHWMANGWWTGKCLQLSWQGSGHRKEDNVAALSSVSNDSCIVVSFLKNREATDVCHCFSFPFLSQHLDALCSGDSIRDPIFPLRERFIGHPPLDRDIYHSKSESHQRRPNLFQVHFSSNSWVCS